MSPFLVSISGIGLIVGGIIRVLFKDYIMDTYNNRSTFTKEQQVGAQVVINVITGIILIFAGIYFFFGGMTGSIGG